MSQGVTPGKALGGNDPRIDQMAQAIKEPILQAVVTAGDEAANVRRFTIQVTNRQRFNRPCRYVVQIWVWDAAYSGSPGAQTLSVATGTLLATLAANETVQVITDTSGKAEVDVTIVGAASRVPHAVVLGKIHTSEAVAWV